MNDRMNFEIDTITKMYQKGFSLNDIAKIYECSPTTVKKKLILNNVEIRGHGGYKSCWNEEYFCNIDTELKAYFLGFIMTDGNVAEREKSSPVIRLQIQTQDKYILEKLKKELNTSNKIETNIRKNNSMSELRVHSKTMFFDLNQYGVVPRKTGIEQFPQLKIPHELHRHFLRGVFDGDGWVTQTTNNRLNAGFCGNDKMMTDIRDYLHKELNLFNVCVTNRKSVSQLIYCSFQDVKTLYDYFYKDSHIYLTRKKEKFDLYYANTELTVNQR